MEELTKNIPLLSLSPSPNRLIYLLFVFERSAIRLCKPLVLWTGIAGKSSEWKSEDLGRMENELRVSQGCGLLKSIGGGNHLHWTFWDPRANGMAKITNDLSEYTLFCTVHITIESCSSVWNRKHARYDCIAFKKIYYDVTQIINGNSNCHMTVVSKASLKGWNVPAVFKSKLQAGKEGKTVIGLKSCLVAIIVGKCRLEIVWY